METCRGQDKEPGDNNCDVITNTSPMRTPFSMGIATKRVRTAPLHEWQTDTLTAASVTNAWNEAVDRTNPTLSPTVRLSNVIQILRKDFSVSGTQQAIDEIGLDDRYSYEQMSATKELARDIERTLLRSSKITGTTDTARRMDGLWKFLIDNAGGNFTDGSGNTFSETIWNDTHMEVWIDSGEPADEGLMSARHKRGVAGFSSNLTRNIDADDRRLVNTIDVYQGDFGPIKLFISEYMDNGTTSASFIIYNNQHMAKAMLRDETIRFAKTGDHEAGSVLTEMTLEVRSPTSCGGWYDQPVDI